MGYVRPPGIRPHDTTHSPEALWQLNGTLNDTSGNGHTLTVEAGTETYAQLGGLQGFSFDGATTVYRNAADTDLRVLGDMTIEMLVSWAVGDPGIAGTINAAGFFVHHGAAGGAEADNEIYALQSVTAPGLRYQAQTGGGPTLVSANTTDLAGITGQVLHYAMTRDSGVITFYINGVSQGSSGALTAPTGGANGRFRLGSARSLAAPVIMTMASVKFLTTVLTANQIAAEARRTVG